MPLTVAAQARRPNVLILMADDLGFSDLGCFGSEIPTPVLDRLAANAIVFSNFHAAATCSPSRAMLLTGVDHHRAGMGTMYEFLELSQFGKPGYEGYLNDAVVTIAELLRSAGYFTAISGKWHLGRQLVIEQAPIGRGFDRSWVLWQGSAEHHTPGLAKFFISGDSRVPYPQGQYSTALFTDKAIEFANEAIEQGKPFLLLASYTAPHWPLEAPADLIEKQKGNYAAGYDVLRQRRTAGLIQKGVLPADVQTAATPPRRPQLHHEFPFETTRSWDELDAEEREYSARMMEVYAAMVESLDRNIGRLLKHLQDREQLDNTLIVFLSDNGAAPSASPLSMYQLERVGRPGSYIAYGPEWAAASSGPLRLMKGYATEGGTRVPAIIKLPHSTRHQLTDEFTSILDIAPTIYELAGVRYPDRFRDHDLHPLDGVSLLPFLSGQRDEVRQSDYSMGWELFGRAAFRQGKWKITWTEQPFGAGDFELFDIVRDPGESRDLRSQHPDVLRRLVAGFEQYTRQYGVIISRPSYWR